MAALPRSIYYLTIGVIITPPVGAATCIWLCLQRRVDWIDLAIFASLFLATAIGITVGLHRHFSHRAFQARPWVTYTLAVLGQLSVQGGVIDWAADHRRHHAQADREGDPHSPHIGARSGLRRLWHAHAGWLLVNRGMSDWNRWAADLVRDPVLLRMQYAFPAYSAASLALPALAGLVAHGLTLDGAWRGFLWGGLFRLFCTHHLTWAVNSLAHSVGKRPFITGDRSTNIGWLAIPTLGDAWHNNHHAFPRSARHGLGPGEIDLAARLIEALVAVGLASDMVTVSEAQMDVKRARPDASANRATPETQSNGGATSADW